jgi:hypothetical protein
MNGSMPVHNGRSTGSSRPGHTRAVLLVTAILSVAPLPVPAADDYLKAIEAEGNKLEYLGKAREEEQALRQQIPVAKPMAKPASTAPVSATTPATMQAFEQSLRQQFPASYALYSLLDPKDREAVYTEYQKSRSEGLARFLPVVSKIIAFSAPSKRAGRTGS